MDFIAEYYLWIKAFHVIAIISWMAGMLYLPRLYVYHTYAEPNSELDRTLQTMERRLLKIIINPAMIASFILGFLLVANIGFKAGLWLHLKILLVLCLAGFHGMLAKYRKDFAAHRNTKPHRYYRILNEVPAVLMMAIVILVIVQPF
jgi:putative membrane protein